MTEEFAELNDTRLRQEQAIYTCLHVIHVCALQICVGLSGGIGLSSKLLRVLANAMRTATATALLIARDPIKTCHTVGFLCMK